MPSQYANIQQVAYCLKHCKFYSKIPYRWKLFFGSGFGMQVELWIQIGVVEDDWQNNSRQGTVKRDIIICFVASRHSVQQDFLPENLMKL